MQVEVAPVSISAGKAAIWPVGGVDGVMVPGLRMPTLMSGPIPGSNRPLRHGMREEPKVHWGLDDLLYRKELVGLEEGATSNVGVPCSIKELNDLAIPHEGKFSSL